MTTNHYNYQNQVYQILNINNIMIHGHKKTDKKKSEEQVQQQNELSLKISNKLAEFFAIRKQPIVIGKLEALIEFTTILMQLCPDITTVFNYRRELIESLLQDQDAQSRAKTLVADIKLITKIIQSDPKSYTLWSYRQWLVLKLYDIEPSILVKEKELCSALLLKDEKNFHVWNYRNWANNIRMDVDAQLEFTRLKVNSNPFNFSPYHFRSKYLPHKYAQLFPSSQVPVQQQILTYGMPKQVFREELETVRTAIFLNPKEEAPWLYYSWLLKQLLPALILDIRVSNANEKSDVSTEYAVLLSLKVQDCKSVFEVSPENHMSLQSASSPSSEWTIKFAHAVNREAVKVAQKINATWLSNESGGRRVVCPSQQQGVNILSEISKVFSEEEKFIQQVLESEDNKCRFAYLQLLELYKLQLYLGVNEEVWTQITTKALGLFKGLEDEAKGQKYVQKQKEYWERLNKGSELSNIEQKLRHTRK